MGSPKYVFEIVWVSVMETDEGVQKVSSIEGLLFVSAIWRDILRFVDISTHPTADRLARRILFKKFGRSTADPNRLNTIHCFETIAASWLATPSETGCAERRF